MGIARSTTRKRPVERLVERLRVEGFHIPDDYRFRRTYAGHWQRSAGAWLWELSWFGGPSLGSANTVKECLKAKRLTFDSNGEIYTENK